MYQAAFAPNMSAPRANTESILARVRLFLRPRPQVDATTELRLIRSRLDALVSSAPTWHPVHLQRVVERTVIAPLEQVMARTDPGTAGSIREALFRLAGVSTVGDIVRAEGVQSAGRALKGLAEARGILGASHG